MPIDAEALNAACTPQSEWELLHKLITQVNDAYARLKTGQEDIQRSFPQIWSSVLLGTPGIDLLNFPAYKRALGAYYSTKRKNESSKVEPFKMYVEASGWSEARIRARQDLSIVFRALKQKGTLKTADLAYRYHVSHEGAHTSAKDVMQKASRAARIAINGVRTGRKAPIALQVSTPRQ